MKKYQEPNYNHEGVDLNIYTAKRADDVEYYADRLDYLKEFHRDKYNMITAIIEMSSIISHDVNNVEDNYEKNYVIREISQIKNKKGIRFVRDVVRALDK